MNEEFLSIFIEEASDILIKSEEQLLLLDDAIKNNQEYSHIVNELFRNAHNIKGSASAVGLTDYSKVVHGVEDILQQIKKNELRPSQTLITLLLKTNDFLLQYIKERQENPNLKFNLELITNKLASFVSQKHPTLSKNIVLETDTTLTQDTDFNIATEQSQDDTIKLKLSRLDNMINSIGELSIYQSMLNEKLRNEHLHPEIKKLVNIMNIITKDIHGQSIGLRMRPLRPTFQKLKRIGREISEKLNKSVEIKLVGDEIELDKIIADELANPLGHILRNALDHGIETEQERHELKKPSTATLKISATVESDLVHILIQDDGRGLQKEKIFSKARAAGLIQDPKKSYTEDEIFNFIMHPGFSTKDEITEISGRGVGMDVVKSMIDKLEGTIEITSKRGQGTTFHITLPLSLSLINGLLVKLSNEHYLIPMSQLASTFDLSHYSVGSVTKKGRTLGLRNEEIPLMSLSALLKLDPGCRQNINENFGIITLHQGRKYALTVDQIIGQKQAVIKKLGPEFDHIKTFSGAAILSDGHPGLIINLAHLIDEKNNQAMVA